MVAICNDVTGFIQTQLVYQANHLVQNRALVAVGTAGVLELAENLGLSS